MLDAVTPRPKVLALHAHDLEGMFTDLRAVGAGVGVDAGPLERKLRNRVEAVVKKVKGAPRRRVFCMEWLDPVFASGHWVPEMVELAGGRDGLARRKRDSARVEWSELAAYAPEQLIVMPCGLTMKQTRRELPGATRLAEWRTLPAVQSGEVYLVDGPSYFNGSGPRLVDGLEILAGIFHPGRVRRRRRRGVAKLRAQDGR